MFSVYDHECMATAIRLAKKGLYTTDPNPRVGCVISRGGRVLGTGWTQPAGNAHAEIAAIDSAETTLEGATVYVTLEPCSHHGRTPPCCEALARHGVERVVIAMQDPNPLVAGSGIEYLRQRGIRVECGLNEAQAREINPGFISRILRDRPWVRVKIAASLDGRTALSNGKSQWITGVSARLDGHRWRARSACILTGSGTVRQDNPSLTARLDGDTAGGSLPVQQPLRAIIDSQLKTDPESKIYSQPGKTLVFSLLESDKFDHLPDVSIIVRSANEIDKVDLSGVLRYLASIEINEVHVEAGAGLCGALLEQNLIDELVIYQAATVLGASARGFFDLPEFKSMDQQVSFKFHDVRRLGKDVRLILRPDNCH